jgi:hypothetical protein
MKKVIIVIFIIFQVACENRPKPNISEYHEITNRAELLICSENYEQASNEYNQAFEKIVKPFGHDVFNAALVSQLANKHDARNAYLQLLINNSDGLGKIKSTFVDAYITEEVWDQLIADRKVEYDLDLRSEFKEIQERDQLFRPMYETHDDTINANRIINMNRILELTELRGFPSQIELGFTESLWGQNHDIVLHHTTQRRSRDKEIMDLEPVLFEAVNKGRFDPERAIFFLNMQNDLDKRNFETYSTWQHVHPLLPDSLNNKIWLPNLNKEQEILANEIRMLWKADKLEDIAAKSNFKAKNNLPFIFTSVRKSIGNMSDEYDLQKALEQYKMATSWMKEYNPN